MAREITLPRTIITYGLLLPLALLVGFVMATPTDLTSIALVGLVFSLITLPLILKWYHPLLIFSWNATVLFFTLPGQPPLWAILAIMGLMLTVVNRTMRRQTSSLSTPSLSRPLMLLFVVAVVTTFATGGIGGRALGSEAWGGKRYLTIYGAIAGYFALVSGSIPRNRRVLYASLYFLSGITAIVSDLAFVGGPAFYFLYWFFPAELASHQAHSTQTTLLRLTGVAWSAQFAYWYILLRYGIRGVFDLRHPLRLLLFLGCIVATLFGGFRSSILLLVVLFSIQFYLEGLFRTKLFPILLLVFALMGSFIVAFVGHLPLPIQRSLSFLPIDVNPVARQDALGSLDWRLQMWKTVVPDVPKYLLLGKGYSYSGTDFVLTQEAIRRGHFEVFESTLVSGNYHNGILTLIIPFGIFGFLAFLWFSLSGLRALHRNFLYGEGYLKNVNTFLLTYYSGRLFFYFVFYGQFDLDLPLFTGTVALSLLLNDGIRSASSPSTS